MESRMEEWARIGAAKRLEEIEEERKNIFLTFPTLQPAAKGMFDDLPSHVVSEMQTTPTPKRGSRKMTEAQKKQVSKRMKAYWRAKRNSQ